MMSVSGKEMKDTVKWREEPEEKIIRSPQKRRSSEFQLEKPFGDSENGHHHHRHQLDSPYLPTLSPPLLL